MVAVFFAVGGLLSTAVILSGNVAGIRETASAPRHTDLFVSVAQGAVTAAALFGIRPAAPIIAVSGNVFLNEPSVFSETQGAITAAR